MARMRYPQQALELLKQEDPGTQVTLNFIRTLANNGSIPHVKVGRRKLINYDALLEFLANPLDHDQKREDLGVIRRVPTRMVR